MKTKLTPTNAIALKYINAQAESNRKDRVIERLIKEGEAQSDRIDTLLKINDFLREKTYH